MKWHAGFIFQIILLTGINQWQLASSDCKYFDPSPNNNNDYVAPDVCIASRVDGVSESYIYECTSESKITAKYYQDGNTTDCTGDPTKTVTHSKHDGYNFDCSENAKDCSSLYRTYTKCNTDSADYQDNAVVTNTCIELTADDSSIWKCNATAEIYTLYPSPDCSKNGIGYTIDNGCQGKTYYQILTCND